ncbi:MAG: hypothetical protein H6742_10435 [Alphaproteobacteria bacterium]|nr:hypothetical protein [Alphaproteobacteria bacterium]
MSTIVILAGLLACGDKDGSDSGDAGSDGATDGATTGEWDGDVGDWIAEEEAEEPPAFDAVAVGASLTEAIALARDVNAVPIFQAIFAVHEGMDATCPTWYEQDGIPYWYDSCRAESGTAFEGYAYIVEAAGLTDDDGNTWDGWQYFGIASIVTGDGRIFQSGGSAGILAGWSADGAQLSYTYMDDGFTDSEAEGTWMADGMDAGTVTWAASYGEGAVGMFVDGTFTELSTDALDAVVLTDVTVTSEGLGGCAVEPDATVSVMDGEGQWFDLVFDGSDGASPDCDGCGTAYWRGVALGEVCTDFSPLADWNGSPWW